MSGQDFIPVLLLITHSIEYVASTQKSRQLVSEVSSRESYLRQNHSSTIVNASKDFSRRESQAENYSYPTPVLFEDVWKRNLEVSAITSYNWTISRVGVSNFRSYAAHFCKDEGRNGAIEVISIGSGDGKIDKQIIEAYRDHFGEKLSITLVDKNPKFKVDYRTVNDLVEKRPNVVGNCVLLIVWPDPAVSSDGYDIDAVRKLQPLAVLTLYEDNGISGSDSFLTLMDDSGRRVRGELDNYEVEKIAHQKINLRAGESVRLGNVTLIQRPGMCAYSYRLVKLKRIGYHKSITKLHRRPRIEAEANSDSSRITRTPTGW